MQTEKAIESYLCRKIKEYGGMCIKLVGVNGIPDRLAILPGGWCVFVELKTDGGRLSPIQMAIHKRLKAMGHDVYTLWDFRQVDKFINEVFYKRGIL